jgi:glutamate/aspartate transport system permease protein
VPPGPVTAAAEKRKDTGDMNYNWNWPVLWEASPHGTGTYLDTLWSGLYWTLATALSAAVIALIVGTLVGIIRTLPNRLAERLANGYVELIRNIPLLVQMFLWFFVAPELLPEKMGLWFKALPNGSFITAVICLGFFHSVRIAVQLSAGIKSLPAGQQLAASALGLTLPQTYRYVLLPMAFRLVLPPLTSECLNIIKNTAVALTIGLLELTATARSMSEFTFQIFEAFATATVIYLLVNVVVVLVMRWLERRVTVPGFIGSATPERKGR